MKKAIHYIRIFIVSLALCMIIGATGVSAATSYDPTALYNKCVSACVSVETLDAYENKYVASGFFAGRKTWVVTAYHNIDSAASIRIFDMTKKEYTLNKIVAFDEQLDIAILSVKEKAPSILSFSSSVKTGQSIWVIGNPYGLYGSMFEGIVSNASPSIEDHYQFTYPSGQGIGGAPILNKYGKLVGMAERTVTSAQCISLGLTNEKVREFLNNWKLYKSYTPEEFYAFVGKCIKASNIAGFIMDEDPVMIDDPSANSNMDKMELTPEEIVAVAEKGYVNILCEYEAEDGTVHKRAGTGYFISDNEIMTNNHIVENYLGNSSFFIYDKDDRPYSVWSVEQSPNERVDAAKITVLCPVGVGREPLKVNTEYLPIIGEKVYAIGRPVGYEQTFVEGIVSMSLSYCYDGYYYQVTTPVSDGCSGGPLFNKFGEVIGMITKKLDNQEKVAFALPVSYYYEMLTA